MSDLNEYIRQTQKETKTGQDLSAKTKNPVGSQIEKEPDATSNIQNCYYCDNYSCSCGNGKDYMDKLVKLITEEVMNRLGS